MRYIVHIGKSTGDQHIPFTRYRKAWGGREGGGGGGGQGGMRIWIREEGEGGKRIGERYRERERCYITATNKLEFDHYIPFLHRVFMFGQLWDV